MTVHLRNLTPAIIVVLAGGLARADQLAPPAAVPAPVTAATSPDRTLADLEVEERSTRAEIESLTPRLADAQRRVVGRGRIFYRLVRAGLLPVGGGFDALVTHAMKVERTRRGLEQDLGEMTRLYDRKTALSKKLEDLALRRGPLEIERQAAERARAALDEQRDRELAFERAFQTSTGARDPEYVAVYGGGVGPDDPGASPRDGFRSMRGRLPIPIAGRTEIRAVRREGTTGPGIEMHAPARTPVRAVYAGRVAFADHYGSLGRIVILDHGDRYYTVMGHLGSIDVRIGDDVSAGAKIGTVGDDVKDPKLYFEVRHGSSTLEPGPWLGL